MKQEQATTAPTLREVGAEPRKRRMRIFSAKEKSQAVLALWSGRRSASRLMKELGVPWGIINTWEKRALTGMLTALDPTWKQPEAGPLRLPARVERLMEQTLAPRPVAEPAVTN
jgi:transposase-like protein